MEKDKREILAMYAYEYGGEWPQISKAIKEKREPMLSQIQEKYVTIYDKEYPESLRALHYPPWVIFYEGDLSLVNRPMITIVGSRKLSQRGEVYTRIAADILKKKYVLVSGLAKGTDALVHACALEQGKTIAVIGSGLKTHYPYCNETLYQNITKEGLILSEYPYYAPVLKHHFPWRNRILAALGESIIVTQAELRSGTMLTVNEALNLSKDVYCFPYPFDSKEGEGCNHLLSQGAGILYSKTQLKDFYPK